MQLLLIVVLVLPLLTEGSTPPPPPRRPESGPRFRLDLHVPPQGGIYFSAWADPEVISDHDGSDGATVQYRRRYLWSDGCRWEATETLVPTAANRYEYTYREAPLSCPRGAAAHTWATTPRDGHVTVHPAEPARRVTPLVAWMRGWRTRRPASP